MTYFDGDGICEWREKHPVSNSGLSQKLTHF